MRKFILSLAALAALGLALPVAVPAANAAGIAVGVGGVGIGVGDHGRHHHRGVFAVRHGHHDRAMDRDHRADRY
jgi:hypothetical protein